MNQIYKVIWSKVRHCCIVVSELGRNDGKAVSSSSRMSKKMAVSLAVMALCVGMVPGVMAADTDTGTGTNWKFGVSVGPDVKTEHEGTATGSKTEIQPGDTVVLQAGRGIKLTQSSTGKGVQIGLKFIDMQPGGWPYNDAKATGSAALAIGQNSVVDEQQGVAVGWKSHSGEFGFAGGSESDAGFSSVAIGYNAKATLEGSVAIGTGVRIDPSKSDSGYKKVDSTYSVAIGEKAYVGEKSTGSNVIGNLAEVTASEYAVVLGTSAKVNKITNGIAIGYNASVITGSGDGGVAIGSYSIAKQRAGLAGYDPEGKDRSSDIYGFWKSGLGAVSVGDKGKTRQITQVAAGTYNMDAVNVAQLKALNTKLSADIKAASLEAGDNIAITKDGDTNKVSLKDTITLGSDTNANNKVKVDGSNGQVVIGAADSGLVIGNQEFTLKNADGTDKIDENGDVVKQSGNYITGLTNTTWDADNIVADRAATEGQLKEIIGTEIGKINESIKNTKQTFVGDSGTKVEIGTTDTLSLTGGADASSLTDKNIGIVNNGKGFKVQLSSKLSDLDSVSTKTLTASDSITVGSGDATTVISGNSVTTGSVTAGNTTVNSDGLTIKDGPSVTKDGIDAGGKAIHNIGEATEATDAINKGTFDTTINNIGSGMNQLGNQINKLDNRVDRVGAGAAALAALHPLDFDPTSRWEFSAGIGNYRGANAVAVGAFYRPNYNTMVSIGSSYGGGENMVNAGVTWRFGEGGTGNYQSKGAMAQEINSLRSVVDEQNSKLASQNDKIEAQNNKIEAQSQQLEEQNKKIEQLMQAIAELKK